jgi:hypothetical protein
MGSGGPGEETLDPRDGMGNGDVEEAGGLVLVGVPAFSLLLFRFPFSRVRCIDTSWCPSHGVNGSGSEPSLAPLVGFRSPGKEINTSWVR